MSPPAGASSRTCPPSNALKHPHVYNVLPESHIRLVILQPGAFQTPLYCSLSTVNLLDYNDVTGLARNPAVKSYEALSYVWGNTERSSQIHCNGSTIQITASLEDVLRRFRYMDQVRVIWVDGICINQSSLAERTQQVQLMGLIYWKARHVLIWLGHDDEVEERWKAHKAFTFMREVSNMYRTSTRVDNHTPNPRKYGVDDISKGEDADSWKAVRQLFDRRWFTRVWVVQELGLAKDATLWCGDASLSISDAYETMSYLNVAAPLFATFYNINLRVLSMAYAYGSSTRGNYRPELGSDPALAESFLDILALARSLQCTDARDSVYGFLGHPSAFKKHLLDSAPYIWYPRSYNKISTVLLPDYSIDTSVLDVYFRLAFIVIDDMDLGHRVLDHVGHDEDSIEDAFPSWVPRWNVDEAVRFPMVASSSYSASGGLDLAPLELTFNETTPGVDLKLKAICLGKVYFYSQLPQAKDFHNLEELESLPTSSEGENPIQDMYGCITELRTSLPNPEYNDDVSFASTFTAGLTQMTEHDTSSMDDFYAYYRSLPAVMGKSKAPLLDVSNESNPTGDADRYLMDVQSVAPYRSFFATQDGRLGLGPRITKGGDEIWLPMGATMPFILRPYANGNFRIIGHTYLHGLMHGEAVKGLTAENFEVVTIF